MESSSEPGVAIPPTIFKVLNSVAAGAGADVTIWTPAPGKRFRLLLYVVNANVATTFLFKDGVGGPVIAADQITAAGGVMMNLGGKGILSAAVGNALVINSSAAVTLVGYVAGTEENPPFTYPKT